MSARSRTSIAISLALLKRGKTSSRYLSLVVTANLVCVSILTAFRKVRRTIQHLDRDADPCLTFSQIPLASSIDSVDALNATTCRLVGTPVMPQFFCRRLRISRKLRDNRTVALLFVSRGTDYHCNRSPVLWIISLSSSPTATTSSPISVVATTQFEPSLIALRCWLTVERPTQSGCC